jgi:hypothetical protein
MPTLTEWGNRGLIRPQGATSVMCASTYPNFASLVSGRLPIEHGIMTNQVVIDGEARPASEVGPASSTFFDGDCEVVVGDQNLIGVMAATSAGTHWPPSGALPTGVDLDLFGYVTDTEVADRVVEAMERRPELLFVQLNSPDTVAHVHGPDSEEAIECYRALDTTLRAIEPAVRWNQDLILVTSDHDQETVDPSRRIDLAGLASQRNGESVVVHEGTAAMVTGPDGLEWVDGVPGLEGREEVGPGITFVYSSPGWWFAEPDFPDFRGAHGGPRTRSAVAVAAGAERLLARIEELFLAPRFGAEDWFPLIQTVRGLRAAT